MEVNKKKKKQEEEEKSATEKFLSMYEEAVDAGYLGTKAKQNLDKKRRRAQSGET